MKRYFLILISAVFISAIPLSAQTVVAPGSSLTATPSTQTVDLSSSNVFNVTFTLSVSGPTPSDLSGFDLYIETIAANSGYFSITMATPGATSPFDEGSGPGDYPDPLSADGGHAGYVQNSGSQGFTSLSDVTTPFSNVVVTLSFTVAANTPNGMYMFQSTGSSSTNLYSSISGGGDDGFNTYYIQTPATFSINVVPEPSTWSLLGLGVFAWLGLTIMRRHRRA